MDSGQAWRLSAAVHGRMGRQLAMVQTGDYKVCRSMHDRRRLWRRRTNGSEISKVGVRDITSGLDRDANRFYSPDETIESGDWQGEAET